MRSDPAAFTLFALNPHAGGYLYSHHLILLYRCGCVWSKPLSLFTAARMAAMGVFAVIPISIACTLRGVVSPAADGPTRSPATEMALGGHQPVEYEGWLSSLSHCWWCVING